MSFICTLFAKKRRRKRRHHLIECVCVRVLCCGGLDQSCNFLIAGRFFQNISLLYFEGHILKMCILVDGFVKLVRGLVQSFAKLASQFRSV